MAGNEFDSKYALYVQRDILCKCQEPQKDNLHGVIVPQGENRISHMFSRNNTSKVDVINALPISCTEKEIGF